MSRAPQQQQANSESLRSSRDYLRSSWRRRSQPTGRPGERAASQSYADGSSSLWTGPELDRCGAESSNGQLLGGCAPFRPPPKRALAESEV